MQISEKAAVIFDDSDRKYNMEEEVHQRFCAENYVQKSDKDTNRKLSRFDYRQWIDSASKFNCDIVFPASWWVLIPLELCRRQVPFH